MATAKSPSVNERVAISLLEVFLVAILLALLVTLVSVSSETQLIAIGAVGPIILLSLIFIYYCRKRKAWSFVGASILGAFGVALRVAISTQPSLEVGGGLPVGVTVLYIVLGSLMSLKSYESFLELRAR